MTASSRNLISEAQITIVNNFEELSVCSLEQETALLFKVAHIDVVFAQAFILKLHDYNA